MTKKFILAFGAIVLITVGVMVWIARLSSANEVRAFMFPGGMVSQEEMIQNLAEYYRLQGSWNDVDTILRGSSGGQRYGWQNRGGMHGSGGMMHGMMMNQRIQIADGQGKVVYDSLNQSIGEQWSADTLALAEVIRMDGQTVGYLMIQGGTMFSRADERRLVEKLNRAALIAGTISGAIGLLLAIFLSFNLMRPIRELTQGAAQIRAGNLAKRVKVYGKDEIGILSETFNRMADSLERAEQTRKTMSADIAHELRNPLAVQRAHLEAMIDGIYPLSVENLQTVLEQNQLLTRLVEDLRTLALAESGQLSLEVAPVNLVELIHRVSDSFQATAAERQIHLILPETSKEDFGSWVVQGDAMRLEQILANLLSNALRYTPPQGKVEISLENVGNQEKIAVKDSGPGIAEADMPYVFERFYRADRSRSRTEGGTGLGLAIARNLAVAHNGWLEAANSPEGGAVFTLTLPKADRDKGNKSKNEDRQ